MQVHINISQKSEATWHIVAVNGGIGRNGGAISEQSQRWKKEKNLALSITTAQTAEKIIMKDGKVAGVMAKDATVKRSK